ncbi:hypothetical protein ACV3UL_07825 [Clostridium perfringens]
MAFIPKYSHFKVITIYKKVDSLSKTDIIDNLKYKEALKKFKELRITLQNSNVILKMVGVTVSGDSIDKFFADLTENTKDAKCIESSNEIIKENVLKESNEENNREILTNSSISEEDIHKTYNSYESFAKSSDCNDDIDYIEQNDELIDSCKYTNDFEFIDKIKEMNLSMHKNIHNAKVNDIIDIVISSLSLLWEKKSHLTELIGLYDKEISVCIHKLEEMSLMDSDCYDETAKLVEIGKQIRSITGKRRLAKIEKQKALRLTEILNISNILKENQLHKLYWEPKDHKIGDGNGTSIFEYRYACEAEKKAILDKIIGKYDKVVVEEDGLIKCYNLVKKISKEKKTKKKNDTEVSFCGNKNFVDVEKVYRNINFIKIKAGQTMPKNKQASIKVLNANLGWIKYYSKLKDRKYNKMIFNDDTRELFMISAQNASN